VLGVKPRPSESVVSCARGGFGGVTVSGEPGFSAPGDVGDFILLPRKKHRTKFNKYDNTVYLWSSFKQLTFWLLKRAKMLTILE